MSPIPAALAVTFVLPGTITPVQVLAALVVVSGVLFALRGAFGELGRWGSAWRILGASIGTGLLTVLSRMLGDLDVGLVETYVTRTALAAAVCIALFPPRQVATRDVPRLLGRSVVVTTYFVCVIVGAQSGSPVVVQTLVATTPLLVLGVEAVRERSLPPVRATVAAGIVLAGVALMFVG
jgi:drug/metabolite transporter (DMT)-like permease